MAGNYPDSPSWRMAYDRDGTQVHMYDNSGVYRMQLSHAQLTALNDEEHTSVYGASAQASAVFIFPELRDLDGFYFNGTYSAPSGSFNNCDVSTDTTNGIDGTWTTIASLASMHHRGGKETYRKDIVSYTALGIRAIRFGFTSAFYTFSIQDVHLYGEPSPNQNLKRLEFWHPTEDHRISAEYLDWGDIPRNTTEQRQFRIKNMHDSLTANAVRVAQDILTDTNPSVVGQHQISKDGGATWGAQQTLDNPLGPGAISDPLIVKRSTPSDAVLSLWWERLFAAPASWS